MGLSVWQKLKVSHIDRLKNENEQLKEQVADLAIEHEVLDKRHAALVKAARAVVDSHVPDYCGMLGVRIDELRTTLEASDE